MPVLLALAFLLAVPKPTTPHVKTTLEIDGILISGFVSAKELPPLGGRPGTKLTPGIPALHRLQLKRSATTGEWKNWVKAVKDKKLEHKAISLIDYNAAAGTEMGRTNYYECLPIPAEFANSGDVETMVVTYKMKEHKK